LLFGIKIILAKIGLNNTIMWVAIIGGVGVVAYFLLKNNIGVKESLDTLGKGLKDAVDAANSSGDWLGKQAHRASEFDIKSRQKEAEVGGAIMAAPGNLFNWLNDTFDAHREKNYKDSEPVRRLLNPKKPTRFDSPRYDRRSRLENPAVRQKA
jgi:hypothetical protein